MKKHRLRTCMLLDEPIKCILELGYTSKYHQRWHDAYLHTFGTFEYHVTEGIWLLFETENYYTTIGHDGVQTYKKPYTFPSAKFHYGNVSDDEWTDYRETLFVGQKIHSIEQNADHQSIYFDDFKLNLYIYEESDAFNFSTGTFGNGINIMDVGGHLLKKCKCGGKGELLIDERNDFAVRCQKCHKATYFDAILKDQIEAWNAHDIPCIINTGRETLQELLENKRKIKYIALSTSPHAFEMINDSFCVCENAMICFEDTCFLLSSQQMCRHKFDFSGFICSNYNHHIWSKEIKAADTIAFVREETDFKGRKMLRFKLDDADLLIAADSHGLAVSLDETQLPMNRNRIKRKTLF
ncbi:MAG: hypothetical protein IJN07_03635 [Clostridia bacterium]|nr:hypothetical protein [Clostridia bacterium]MBQ6706585.1 hypothetical protein [Clostridia bacterium]